MTNKPIEIIWVDSVSTKGGVWIDPEEVYTGLHKVKTVGYILEETKKTITLAASVSVKNPKTEQVSGVMCIPKCSILRQG